MYALLTPQGDLMKFDTLEEAKKNQGYYGGTLKVRQSDTTKPSIKGRVTKNI